MYDTINEFILSNSEAIGAVMMIVTFLTVFLVGLTPLFAYFGNSMMGQ